MFTMADQRFPFTSDNLHLSDPKSALKTTDPKSNGERMSVQSIAPMRLKSICGAPASAAELDYPRHQNEGSGDSPLKSAIDCTNGLEEASGFQALVNATDCPIEPSAGTEPLVLVNGIACAKLDEIALYVHASLAINTRKAYLSDLRQFEAWGGCIPSEPHLVAAYLAAQASKLKPASLARHLISISKAHEAKGLSSPTSSSLVKTVLRGIQRTHGQPPKGAKPLLRDDLFLVLDKMGDRPKDLRDRALLLLGFAGGFRRSELVGLNLGDVERVRQGLIITLTHSKTDQTARGRKIGIPLGRTRHCPVTAVETWIASSGITEGPLFRPIRKSGLIDPARLSGDALCRMVQKRVAIAGLNPTRYSGHSLRSGFATSAAQAGVSSLKIRHQTGHASEAMLYRYVRSGELFLENAVQALL